MNVFRHQVRCGSIVQYLGKSAIETDREWTQGFGSLLGRVGTQLAVLQSKVLITWSRISTGPARQREFQKT
jgi:hypothetical protein